MRKPKFLSLFLALLSIITLASCNIQVFARITGTIGSGINAVWVDIGLVNFLSSSSGSAESTRLILRFDNGSGEFIEFTLAPQSTKSTELAQMFGTGTYSIDGSNSKVSGSVQVGTTSVSFSSSSGQVIMDILSISSGSVTAIKGTYTLNVESGGRVDGTFAWQSGK